MNHLSSLISSKSQFSSRRLQSSSNQKVSTSNPEKKLEEEKSKSLKSESPETSRKKEGVNASSAHHLHSSVESRGLKIEDSPKVLIEKANAIIIDLKKHNYNYSNEQDLPINLKEFKKQLFDVLKFLTKCLAAKLDTSSVTPLFKGALKILYLIAGDKGFKKESSHPESSIPQDPSQDINIELEKLNTNLDGLMEQVFRLEVGIMVNQELNADPLKFKEEILKAMQIEKTFPFETSEKTFIVTMVDKVMKERQEKSTSTGPVKSILSAEPLERVNQERVSLGQAADSRKTTFTTPPKSGLEADSEQNPEVYPELKRELKNVLKKLEENLQKLHEESVVKYEELGVKDEATQKKIAELNTALTTAFELGNTANSRIGELQEELKEYVKTRLALKEALKEELKEELKEALKASLPRIIKDEIEKKIKEEKANPEVTTSRSASPTAQATAVAQAASPAAAFPEIPVRNESIQTNVFPEAPGESLVKSEREIENSAEAEKLGSPAAQATAVAQAASPAASRPASPAASRPASPAASRPASPATSRPASPEVKPEPSASKPPISPAAGSPTAQAAEVKPEPSASKPPISPAAGSPTTAWKIQGSLVERLRAEFQGGTPPQSQPHKVESGVNKVNLSRVEETRMIFQRLSPNDKGPVAKGLDKFEQNKERESASPDKPGNKEEAQSGAGNRGKGRNSAHAMTSQAQQKKTGT